MSFQLGNLGHLGDLFEYTRVRVTELARSLGAPSETPAMIDFRESMKDDLVLAPPEPTDDDCWSGVTIAESADSSAIHKFQY